MTSQTEKTIIDIIHNVRSLHNVGSIFRTAEAIGIKQIYLTGITPSPLDILGRWENKFIKVSLGAEKTLAWKKLKSINKLMLKLKKDDFKIVAIEQDKKSHQAAWLKKKLIKNRRVVVVVGSETKGLEQEILEKVDFILEIPMKGQKESLNVAVAFGVGVYLLFD